MTEPEPSFFQLKRPVVELSDETEFYNLVSNSTDVENILYRPETLTSNRGRSRAVVKDTSFRNASFSFTDINHIEFTNCKFVECLFIDTKFKNCRFTACEFINCNPHRIDFEQCFVDPKYFEKCIPDAKYANIGVYLFQQLLRNSRLEAQPDFSDEAQFLFRRWQRHLARHGIRDQPDKRGKVAESWRFLSLWLFEQLAGSGVRLSRLVVSAALTLAGMSVINWKFADELGLKHSGQQLRTFVESFYFSTIVTTTVGFGDVVPDQAIGQIVVSIEALIGLVFFAMLTSTIYHRVSSR